MRVRTLLPDDRSLKLLSVKSDESTQRVTIRVQSIANSCACPVCGRLSRRVHSFYERRHKDLPWQGFSVFVVWRTRRCFCDALSCERKIFSERRNAIAVVHSRRTQRLTQVLRSIVMTCGGEAGSHLARRLGVQVSGDTLRREARRTIIKMRRAPRAIGVDDWAYRKGRRYGTLICDLESGQRLDLLPDRDADQFAGWLRERPEVAIISRDRSDIYRKGATLDAPNAVQVADRFHLMKNLRDAFANFLEGQQPSLRAAIANAKSSADETKKVEESLGRKPPTKEQERKIATRTRRVELYDRVMELHNIGVSDRSIARQVGIHRSTVRKFGRIS